MTNGQGWQTFTWQDLNISTAISQSLSGTTKNADEDCQLVVETPQESVKVCQSRLHCFYFACSIIPYTHQPGKTFSLTASIVLFSDPSKLLLQYPQSKILWTPGCLVTHQTQIVLIAAHFWDNIPWEFSGCWKVLRAKIISSGDNRTWIEQWPYSFSSLVYSSLKVHFSYRLKFFVA